MAKLKKIYVDKTQIMANYDKIKRNLDYLQTKMLILKEKKGEKSPENNIWHKKVFWLEQLDTSTTDEM